MARRQTKVTKQNLIAIKERFASFLDGRTNIIADEAFKNAVKSYQDSFLCSDRVAKMVCLITVWQKLHYICFTTILSNFWGCESLIVNV